MTHHVVQYSGGIGSWATAYLVTTKIQQPGDRITLLFADVLMEDEDTYAFLEAGARALGLEVTRIDQGKSIWDVFVEQQFLGNSRIDPCSKFLKRVPLRKWIEANCDPEDTVIHLGIDWTEVHRLDRARPHWKPWTVMAPLIDERVAKETMHQWAAEHGLPRQRLYEMGLPHANCGGGCVKAGVGHFKLLLEKFPERYREWEEGEARVQAALKRNQDSTILRRTRNGVRERLSLRQLREEIEQQGCGQLDLFDMGGCGCAID